MFTTDKELRAKKSIHTGRKTSGLQSKLPSPSSSLSSNPHNENNALSKATVLDQARIAREERQLGRECLKSALIIQSWWRMCHQQRKWRSQLRSDVVKKCQDIERVNSILKTVVCPDVGIGITLIRSFIFSLSTNNYDNVKKEETKAMTLSLLLLCKCVLVPSLMNMDTSKNIAAAMSLHLSCRLILLILRYYETLPRVPPSSSDVVSILNCLPLLIGEGESFRMKFSENLRNSFDNIRRKLEKLDIIDRICSIFFQKLEPWMLHTNNGDSASTSIVGNLSSVNGPMLDILMRFLLNLLVSNNTGPSGLQLKSNASPSARALHFFRIVLAAPMLSLQLSAPVLTMLISLEEFDSILHSFVDSFPHLQLAPSPLAAFEPALWLLGNLCFVGSCILKHAAEMKSRRADQLLSAYLVLLSKLLITSPVPGFLCGRRSVVWTMRGSEAIAAGVPSGLYAQANALFELHFLQGLLAYHLFIDVSSYPLVGTAEDVLEIETSQRSSSLQITSESIKEATLDQSWLSGNWAKKLLGNVSATLTMTSRKESSYFDVATGSGKANVDSVKKLCILLSIILPPATFAHFASDNYKGLSTFVFSTPDLSRKLWIALRLMHIEKFACHCNVERDFTPSGVFAVVLTFAAVLRVQLLASDDNDLLKKEVSYNCLMEFCRKR